MAVECNECHGTGEVVFLDKNGIFKGYVCKKCNGVGNITNVDERIKVYVFVAVFWIGIFSLIYHTCNAIR